MCNLYHPGRFSSGPRSKGGRGRACNRSNSIFLLAGGRDGMAQVDGFDSRRVVVVPELPGLSFLYPRFNDLLASSSTNASPKEKDNPSVSSHDDSLAMFARRPNTGGFF